MYSTSLLSCSLTRVHTKHHVYTHTHTHTHHTHIHHTHTHTHTPHTVLLLWCGLPEASMEHRQPQEAVQEVGQETGAERRASRQQRQRTGERTVRRQQPCIVHICDGTILYSSIIFSIYNIIIPCHALASFPCHMAWVRAPNVCIARLVS